MLKSHVNVHVEPAGPAEERMPPLSSPIPALPLADAATVDGARQREAWQVQGPFFRQCGGEGVDVGVGVCLFFSLRDSSSAAPPRGAGNGSNKQ